MRLLIAALILISSLTPAQIREWVKLGNDCLDRGDGIGAAEYYKRCSDSVRTGRNAIPLNQSLFNIAKLYRRVGDLDEAEKYIERSIRLGMILDRPGSVALRYLEASKIALGKNNTEKALEYAIAGLEYADKIRNENTMGQILIQIGDCHAAMSDYRQADSLYSEAVKWLGIQGKGRFFVPEAYKKLGMNAERSGDTVAAGIYYKKMLEETTWGFDHLQMFEAYTCLASLVKDSDPVLSRQYAACADSLSYAADVAALGDRLALSNLEFPRRERELQLVILKQKTTMFAVIGIMGILLAAMFCLLMLHKERARKTLERRNADLVKVNLQKDRLIAIARAASPAVEEISQIEGENVPIPDIKLTKREFEIATMTAKGMQNKEIADALGISPRTVGVHKNNLFKKVGVGNSIELLQYLRKIGY